MDYNSCSKLFMEYGKINQMTISEDGKSVLVRYFSLSGAAKAFDALKSIGYDISFISHVFQHLAEAKAAKEPEAEPIATETV
jgi:UDP-glucose 4-epimerase